MQIPETLRENPQFPRKDGRLIPAYNGLYRFIYKGFSVF